MVANKPILHQIIAGATVGDAITDQAFLLRRWLRRMGFESHIFSEHIHPGLQKEIRLLSGYRPQPAESHIIYHHSIGSGAVEKLLSASIAIILIYHNVTPPEFFTTVDPALARQMKMGREQLLVLRPRTVLALADSGFNEIDLKEAGFPKTGVLPIVLDEGRYNYGPNPELVARYENSGPLLLFVGRLVPNKKQEDLIKLLYFYRRLEPGACLLLVGGSWLPAYTNWLKDLACDLGLGKAVIITEHVSQQDMVTYYRLADLYVSMSEHEGFGKPLVESMALDLPVLAYGVTAVPWTMGGAGVQFHAKDYEALAELVDILVRDTVLRERIIARQHVESQRFLEPQVHQAWAGYIRPFIKYR